VGNLKKKDTNLGPGVNLFFSYTNAKGDLRESKPLTLVDQVKRREKQRRKPLTLGDQEVTRKGFEWCC